MIAVIGGGPAGLYAAENASQAGLAVTLFDAKASVGRKFLVAGGGGLNLTKDEPAERFVSRYEGPHMPTDLWPRLIGEFGPDRLREWAMGLGVETFVASTGRVYPSEMKAAPLLRRWVQRLRHSGVKFATHHRWEGWCEGSLVFHTPEGERSLRPAATILALGGGSWPETGSDGGWADILRSHGIAVAPLAAANCGWEVDWPAELVVAAEGMPLKNVAVRAGDDREVRGELMITHYGLEGGAIYQAGAALRAMDSPELWLDLKPAVSAERLIQRLGPAKRNLRAEAKARWRLGAGAEAMLDHHPERDSWTTPEAMAKAVKRLRVALIRPRPIAEAISSAGGVRWSEIDASLMLRRMPGVFVAGEMIDWEAPTGGYLMQGAFATGKRAGESAALWTRRG
jgi:uncharacterized flavoprotein (TIGR03862 family)